MSTLERDDATLAELTPDELEMLGHCLRMVPDNACLTGSAATRLAAGRGFAMFTEVDAFKSLWEKVAAAIRTRDDMADRRVTPAAPELTP